MGKEYKNIKEMLNNSTVKYKDKTAFIDINENDKLVYITYGKLKEDLDALGTGMRVLGLDKNKVVIIGRNRYHWALSFLASTCSNGITVPLDKELPDNEIQKCINRVEADTVIYSSEFEQRIEDMSKNICIKNFISMDSKELSPEEIIKDEKEETVNKNHYDIDQTNNNKKLSLEEIIAIGKKEIAKGNLDYIDQTIDNDKVFELLFTSGTTSDPKIPMLSQTNVISNVNSATRRIKISNKDVLLSVLPLHHTFENTCGLIAPLSRGATIGYNDSLKNVIKNMQQIKPSIMLVVPRFLELFISKMEKTIEKNGQTKKFSKAVKIAKIFPNSIKRIVFFRRVHKAFGGRMRMFLVGASAMNPKDAEHMRKIGIITLQGYGMTECSPIITLNSEKHFRDYSVGYVLEGTTVKIDKPDKNGIGEILVKGPQVMKGYYKNEEATKAVMTEDSFLRTGDLGNFTKHRFLVITGRCKNMILGSNGENIYPEDIESLLRKNKSIVKETFVHAENEGAKNMKLIAEVVLSDEIAKKIVKHPEYEAEIQQVIKDYVNEINSQLPAFKRINQFHTYTEEFQKTTTLKIQREKVLEKQKNQNQ